MTSPTSTEIARIETLSAEVHKCYCRAYERRFGKPYWTNGDYSKLDEATKDYDREMARFMIEAIDSAIEAEREEICKLCCRLCGSDKYELRKNPDGNWNHYGKLTRDVISCDAQAIRARGKK